jgi:DNA-binding MarR family transcriptional regulator
MISAETVTPVSCARQTLALLPVLRQWVTARVQATGADAGLSLRQYAALHTICQGATSPGELARQWQVTPAVITGVIDRLERRGLVSREPDPADRRRLRLALTESGMAASVAVERALTDELAGELATASPRDLAALAHSLDLLQRTFASLGARAPRPDPLRADEGPPDWEEDEPMRAENHREDQRHESSRAPGRDRSTSWV